MRNPVNWNGGSPSLVAVGRFAALGFSLISVPIVARALGPDGRGQSAAMLAAVGIITVLVGLGAPLALRRRVASGAAIRAVVPAGRSFATLTALPAVALALVTDLLLFRQTPLDAQIVFIISLLLVPFSVSWAQDVSVLVATRRFTKIAILSTVQSATSLFLAVVLWRLDELTVAGVLLASLAGNISAAILGLCWVRARLWNMKGVRSVAREGRSLVGAQLADIASRRLDQVIALPLLGASGAGLYSVASTIALLSTPIAQALAAGMFNSMVGKDNKLGAAAIRYGMIIGVPTTLVLVLVSYFGVPLVFGPDFAQAVWPTIALACAAPAIISTYAASIWLVAQERGSDLTRSQAIGLAISMALFFFGAISFGVFGAAVGITLGAYVTLFLVGRLATESLSDWIFRAGDLSRALAALLKN